MLSKNTKIIASLSVLFFCVSIGVYVTFFMLVEKHKVDLHEKKVAYAQVVHDSDSVASLLNTLSETEDERAKLASYVIKDDAVVTFLGLIESLGREQGVSLTTNSLTVKPINETFETLIIDVSVEGQYEAIMSALTLFEHLPYQSSVHDVRIEKGGKDNEKYWKSAYTIQVTKFKKI